MDAQFEGDSHSMRSGRHGRPRMAYMGLNGEVGLDLGSVDVKADELAL